MEFLGYKQGDLPVTESIVNNILSLPMFAELKAEEIEYITSSIINFLK